MLFFIVVAHWLACIWYVIAEKERLRNDKDWDLGKSLRVIRTFICKLHPATRSTVEFLRERTRMEVAGLSVLREHASVLSISSFKNNLKDGLRDLYKNHSTLP